MTKIKNLEDLLQKVIMAEHSFRVYGKDVIVKKITDFQNLRIWEGENPEDDFHFQATANISIPEGDNLSEETYNMEGSFNVDDNENVVINGKISITKR